MSTTYTSPAAPGGGSNKPLATNIDAVDKSSILDYIEKDIQPVGQDYIEEIRSEEGIKIFFLNTMAGWLLLHTWLEQQFMFLCT